MALYQPTNITPSLTGALGNGICDITKGLTVSWQVNGNSPMTAFQITIYENNAESTQVYTTGKRTDSCPFCNTTTPSNITKVKTVFFSYEIDSDVLASAGMKNGREYKIVITQWWSANDNVVQSSASVFKTRAAAKLEISEVPQEISTKNYTFSASYEQAQGDVLNFIEWQIHMGNGELLYDTGKLYSTSDMQFTYDGFFTGETYTVRCFGQTAGNEEVESAEVTFSAMYDTVQVQNALTASCVPSGVKVSWAGLVNIPGTPAGDYSINDDILELDNNGMITWDTVNNEPMNYEKPWSLVWKGIIPHKNFPFAYLCFLEYANAENLGCSLAYHKRGEVWVSYKTTAAEPMKPSFPFTSLSDVVILGNVRYSPQTTPWRECSTEGMKGTFHFFNYANGIYVAAGAGTNTDGVWYSTDDAETWTKSNIDMGSVYDIQYGNGLWIASTDNGVFYSYDVINWVQSNITQATNRAKYASGIWVAGCSVQGSRNGLWYSIDGINWVQSNFTSESINSVDYHEGLWVAGSEYGMYHSEDGKQWTRGTGLTAGNVWLSGYDSGTWIASGSTAGLWYSTDGKNWTQSNVKDTIVWNAIYVDGIWSAAGGQHVYYSSNGGRSWGYSTSITGPVHQVTYDGHLYFAAGADGTIYFTYFYTGTWQKAFSIEQGDWLTVEYINGKWFAGSGGGGGNGGGIYTLDIDDSKSINPGDIVTLVITPDTIYCQAERPAGGLVPSKYLYPKQTIYPRDSTAKIINFVKSVPYSQENVKSVNLLGSQKCYYLQLIKETPVDYAQYFTSGYTPIFDENTYFLTDFKNGLQAGNVPENITTIGYSIYRRRNGEQTIRHIGDTAYDSNVLYDYGVMNQGGEYTYYMFTIGTDKYATAPLKSNEVSPLTWEWTLLDCIEEENGIYTLKAKYSFGKNLESGSISNNNSPSVLNNFTRYPKVQSAPQNYLSGTLQSLIGAVGFNSFGRYVYSDSIELKNAIYELSTTTDTLFLKDRKGSIIKVRISGPIMMTTSDSTVQQAQTVSLPWTEVGDASDASIISPVQVASAAVETTGIYEMTGGSGGLHSAKYLPLTGGTLTGSVTFEKGADMAENRITSVAVPSEGGDAANKQYVDSEIKSEIEEAAPIVRNNVTVAAGDFRADSTYAEFPYAAKISISGVSASDIPEVVFSADDAASNNFASVCSSVAGGIVIYAACVPDESITIPTVIVRRQM